MVFSIRRFAYWLKFMMLFLLLSFLLYQLFSFCAPFFQPSEWHEPGNGAMKVFAPVHDNQIPSDMSLLTRIKERLLVYYFLGE